MCISIIKMATWYSSDNFHYQLVTGDINLVEHVSIYTLQFLTFFIYFFFIGNLKGVSSRHIDHAADDPRNGGHYNWSLPSNSRQAKAAKSPLTLLIPCGVNLTPEDHFHVLHTNHRHHRSEILWLCRAIYCNFISDNVLQFHARMASTIIKYVLGSDQTPANNCNATT